MSAGPRPALWERGSTSATYWEMWCRRHNDTRYGGFPGSTLAAVAYSAAAVYLREIQFDQIKLDGALIKAASSSDGERLLGAVIGMCNALGVSTAAEHIESEEQLKLLLKLGCTFGQGFWLHRPLSAETVRKLSSGDALLGAQARALRNRSAA